MTSPPRGRGLYELQAIGSDSFIVGAKASAAGVASFNIAPSGVGNADWLVTYIAATAALSGAVSTASAPQCVLYVDALAWGNLWDLTAVGAGAGSVAWYNPPRRLKATQQLIAVFTGLNSGDYAQVRCEYLRDDADNR